MQGRWQRLSEGLERLIIVAVRVLLLIVILLSVVVLAVLTVRGIGENPLRSIQSAVELQERVLNAFSGVLTVLLGLELLETIRTWFAEQRVRLEVILIIATIAVSRHIVTLDFEHAGGLELVGIGVLVAALGLAYALVRGSPAVTLPLNKTGDPS